MKRYKALFVGHGCSAIQVVRSIFQTNSTFFPKDLWKIYPTQYFLNFLHTQETLRCICQNYNSHSLFCLLMRKLYLFPVFYASILCKVLRRDEPRATKKADKVVYTFTYLLKCYFWFCRLLTVSCLCLFKLPFIQSRYSSKIKNSVNTQCETVTLLLWMK